MWTMCESHWISLMGVRNCHLLISVSCITAINWWAIHLKIIHSIWNYWVPSNESDERRFGINCERQILRNTKIEQKCSQNRAVWTCIYILMIQVVEIKWISCGYLHGTKGVISKIKFLSWNGSLIEFKPQLKCISRVTSNFKNRLLYKLQP